jgi:hypothetical protein
MLLYSYYIAILSWFHLGRVGLQQIAASAK